MGKLFFDWLNKISDKMFSARFLITIMFGLTYSHIVWHVVHSYLESMKSKPELLEAFATGVFTGFSGLAVLVVKSYFDRVDRADEAKATQITGSAHSTATAATDPTKGAAAQINAIPGEVKT